MDLLAFCGHRFGNDPAFIHAMHGVGQAIAENKWRLLYGGSEEGLMGVVASAVIGHGGIVTGIIPEFLLEVEKPLAALERAPHMLIKTKTMSERKDRMFELADAIVTGPGGPGTRDEFWEAVTNTQVGQCKKPHIVLNVNGCFDSLEADIDHLIACGFAEPNLKPPFLHRFEDVLPTLRRMLGECNVVDLERHRLAG